MGGEGRQRAETRCRFRASAGATFKKGGLCDGEENAEKWEKNWASKGHPRPAGLAVC